MKLEPRAHIDYLMEHNFIIIYQIWVFSHYKIIRSRDVLFNENFTYDFSDAPNLLYFIVFPTKNAFYDIIEKHTFCN